MNSTLKKFSLKNILALLLVVLFSNMTVFAETVSAKMAASMAAPIQLDPVPISSVISYYTKKQATQKLTEDEANILKLSTLAQDVFEAKNFNVSPGLKTEQQKVEAVKLVHVGAIIINTIEQKQNWNESLSASNVQKLKESTEVLNRTISSSSYSWAWIQNQIGNKDEAKKILTASFDEAYTNVMKMTATYNRHASPLVQAERLSAALKPMSTDNENKSRESKIKEMRTHVSNIPDMQIMT